MRVSLHTHPSHVREVDSGCSSTVSEAKAWGISIYSRLAGVRRC